MKKLTFHKPHSHVLTMGESVEQSLWSRFRLQGKSLPNTDRWQASKADDPDTEAGEDDDEGAEEDEEEELNLATVQHRWTLWLVERSAYCGSRDLAV